MPEWADRAERRASARAEYEHIMTTGSPDPTGAYIESGVIGFVFGEMWRRGVLTPRDRRLITLTCVGAAGAGVPIETHVWAALNSGDLTSEEFDEFVLHFATQLGWPKAAPMSMHGMFSMLRLAEERGEDPVPLDFEPWTEPTDDAARRARGEAGFAAVHGDPPGDDDAAITAFRGRAYLDYLYGEIWTRDRHLTRRDRRIVSICGAASVGVDEETRAHVRAALAMGDLTYEELQELVVHYAVYLGWNLGSHLDRIVVAAAGELG